MSSNQPSQPTPATRFLVHTLYSFGIGLLIAILTAIGQYVATSGDSIDLRIVVSVGGAAFLAYLLSHFNKDILSNQVQLLQGIDDAVTQATQNAHAPLYNAVGQLQQQVAQVAQTVQAPQLPPAPLPVPISEAATQDMPVVIASQPWQPPAQGISFGDSAVMPAIPQ